MRTVFALLLFLVSIPLTLRMPVLGLAFYLGANIIRPEMLFWAGTEANYVFKFWVILLFIILIKDNYLSRLNRLACKEIILMVCMFIGVIISTIFSQYNGGDSDYYFTIEIVKHIIFCCLIVIIVNDIDDIILLQKSMLGCFFFMGLWGIIQSIGGNDRLEGLGGSAWPDSNFVASMFVLFLPVALARIFYEDRKKNVVLALTVFIVMAILIICTKSRAGTIGLVVSIISFGYFAGKMKNTIAVFALLAIMITPFLDEAYFSRMKTMQSGESIESDSSAQTRLVLWKSAAFIFFDNPIIGTGFFTFPDAKFKYSNRFSEFDDKLIQEVFREDRKFVTHNTYLQMLADCGLLGAVPFFILIYLSIKQGIASRKLLKQFPDKSKSILWLSGISAGISGFAVCIFTLNAITIFLMYTQIIFASITMKMLVKQINIKPDTSYE